MSVNYILSMGKLKWSYLFLNDKKIVNKIHRIISTQLELVFIVRINVDIFK